MYPKTPLSRMSARSRPVLASQTGPENRPDERTTELVMRHTSADRAHRPARGLAASLGGWSARHRKTAIGAWLLFVVAATMLGAAAGRAGLPGYRQGAGDSARADQIVASANIGQPATELVLVHSNDTTVTVRS